MKRLLSGTVLTCPECHREMVRLINDIEAGQTVCTTDFEPIGDSPVHGSPIVCPFDGSAYARTTRLNKYTIRGELHTSQGWI